MGQAFDAEGRLMGEAFGISKQDVFEQLNKAHADAAEIRIRTLAASDVQTPMPKYRCHKDVWALKIRAVHVASGVLAFDDPRYSPRAMSAAYMGKHRPHAGGYFVQYADGYESFSPADAFELGYTRIEGT